MSAVILHHPIFDRLRADMKRAGLFDNMGLNQPENVVSLRDARVKREREASERRYAALHGGDFDPRPAA